MPRHFVFMVLWSHGSWGTSASCIDHFEIADDADMADYEKLDGVKFTMLHYTGESQIVEFSCKEDAKEFVDYKMNKMLSS
ncbi:hypothetical protein [Medusavirus stheno T3]|uniref:Uncharacterized protein n=1 Tax=Medusavirus stheno T3 TaxID=3069717 RepID=A0A7S8BD81_9VIRU|nr:hypothetical protein QKU73_gp186 [Acanthamoeba castellanii medusavirus]QPB44589.1 hypothetical protein [Medusavirus stheno T3]